MTERAIELLNLQGKGNCLILDIGCGSGISGEVLTENGFAWVGIDISRAMLGIEKQNFVLSEDRCGKRKECGRGINSNGYG